MTWESAGFMASGDYMCCSGSINGVRFKVDPPVRVRSGENLRLVCLPDGQYTVEVDVESRQHQAEPQGNKDAEPV